jgi:uncharacterized protein YegL
VFEKDAPRLSCPCGHEGSNFTKINLSVNVAGITVEGENGIVTEKMLALFLCPVCGTVKALLPSHLNTNSIGVPADEPRSENSAGAVSSPPSFDERNIDLFFMIDTSGSMEGSSIGSVNSVFEELMLELKRIVEDNPGLHIKTAALEFSSGARWITRDGPVPVEQFQWKPIEADGVTDVGEAFKLLDKTLSTETFPVDESGKAEIVLFLLTDGSPTDNWQNEFEKLKRNNWFKASRKFGVAIGDDADIDMLKEFTGSEESVVETFDAAWIVNKGILESRNRSSNRKDNHEDNTREDDDVW